MTHSKCLVICLFLVFFQEPFFAQTLNKNHLGKKVKVQWERSLNTDFSFIKKWKYQEDIEKDSLGQLICASCTGINQQEYFSPSGILVWENIEKYYKQVDTSHYHYQISCESNAYEFAGTHYIDVSYISDDLLKIRTKKSKSTFSILEIFINRKNASAQIVMSSQRAGENSTILPLKSGNIKINKKKWKVGQLALEFSFLFDNIIETNRDIYWNGKILCFLPK